MKIPKLIFTDIDGVWTDGGMYYDQTGNEWKKFNTSDSMGILYCRLLNIKTVILTGETTEIVKRRSDKLKVDHLFMGCKNKLKIANELLSSLNIDLHETAYIGDDLLDVHLLEKVGFSGAPSNALEYIKSRVSFITPQAGGQGAFRGFVEEILKRTGQIDHATKLVLDTYTH